MYAIVVDGEIIDWVVEPNFVKKEDGVMKSCVQWEADAIAVHSKLYSILGKPAMRWPVYEEVDPDAVDEDGLPIPPKKIGEKDAPIATVIEKDAARFVSENVKQQEQLQQNVDEQTEYFEMMLLEIDSFYGAQLEMMEEAMLELDSMLMENVTPEDATEEETTDE